MSTAGIDIGTTGTKVTVFDREGRTLAQAYREYPLIYPRPGWIEIDPSRVISDARSALAEAAAKSRKDPIRALALSTLGEAAAPIDGRGKIIGNAIAGFDARGGEECAALEAAIGRARLFRMTGAPPNHIFSICKIMWLKKNRREKFRRVKKFLLFEDLFLHSLGLEPRISHSLAARTMAFNIHDMRWEPDVLAAAGIDESIFAAPAPAGSVVGEIPASTAKQLGLARGCIAVVGGHDQICAAFGAGIIRPGLACDSTGTVECITLCMSRAAVNPKMLKSNFCCSPHVIPGLYTTLAFNFTGGSLLRWFRDNFAAADAETAKKTGRDVYDVMLENASQKPTALFVLPHFSTSGTPHFDPDAFGAIIGLKFDTGRDQITRAILEGVTLEIRANIELLKQAGADVSELYAIGGGARSDYWLQMKADIFGRPVTALGVSEAGGLGAAMLAGLALGDYKSPAEAAAICVKTKKRYTPEPKNKIYYDGRLKAFRAIYPTLKAWAKNIQ